MLPYVNRLAMPFVYRASNDLSTVKGALVLRLWSFAMAVLPFRFF
ncbi:MAG: hypothetical protein NVS2B7_37940 [Herpetosiphon sp.]